MLVLKLAWRNLWRNARRTLITAAALGLSVMSVVLMNGLVEGITAKTVTVATRSHTGDAQLHAPDYQQTQDELLVLQGSAALLEEARATPGVREAAPRIWSLGLLSIADRSRGVKLLGIDPEHERGVTNWHERLIAGNYLTSGDAREVMLGETLAEKLQVEVGSKLVISASMLESGEGTSELVRVAGIYATGDTMLDKGVAMVPLALASRLTGLSDQVHEVALDLEVDASDEARIAQLIAPLSSPQVDAQPWHQINRMVAQGLALQEKWMGIAALLFFLVISFAIINTVAMSLAERMKEFGVMRALGTSAALLAGLVVSEAAMLGLVGALPGALIGLGITFYFQRYGLDFSDSAQYGMRFIEPIHPVPDVPGALRVVLLFTVLTMLTAAVSAWRAARIEPVEAMRQ